MWSDADPPHLSDQTFGVVVLVGSERFLVGTGEPCCHRLGGIPLTGARGLCHAAIDDQVMTVVHEHMAPVAQFSWMGIGLTGQQSLGIAAGAVGFIAELGAAKVTFGALLTLLGSSESLTRASGWKWRILRAINPLQGGMAGPGLQQRGIHREVVVPEQGFDLGSSHPLRSRWPRINECAGVPFSYGWQGF